MRAPVRGRESVAGARYGRRRPPCQVRAAANGSGATVSAEWGTETTPPRKIDSAFRGPPGLGCTTLPPSKAGPTSAMSVYFLTLTYKCYYYYMYNSYA